MTFISAVGALFTKTLAKRVLELTGFRRLLVVNALIGAVFIGLNGFFTPSTPHWIIMTILFAGGCFRSMQFTSLNAIAYADVSHRDMSSATSLSSVSQQLSLSIGVALGAGALEASARMRGAEHDRAGGFRRSRSGWWRCLAALSALVFLRLPPDAGAEMSGHRAFQRQAPSTGLEVDGGTALRMLYLGGRHDRSGPMDKRIIDLYDDFTHGGMNRRTFIDRLAALAGSTAAATALLPILQNNYAQAQTIPENDPRIVAEMVDIPGAPGLKGYLVRPKTGGKLPAVIVIHENRGLNPHIKDVTRRMATEGFLALGLDYLSPMGGTPADEDKGRDMIGQLKQPDVDRLRQGGRRLS